MSSRMVAGHQKTKQSLDAWNLQPHSHPQGEERAGNGVSD